MSLALKSEKPSDVKSHILDTSKRLIAARGFSAVGLNEILLGAGIPKGSFYHYFASKDAFGKALLEYYFENYLAEVDLLLADECVSARERLAAYWRFWRDNQERDDPEGKCLAVKLGAEVSDISEGMRIALKNGTSAIVNRLSRVVKQGLADGSIESSRNPYDVAETLYQLWLGASVMTKIARSPAPFDAALAATDQILSGK
ncbi:TetR/AcrR family transcriptional regulator [Paracoccus onubensis]|uniref:TetR/AcrR family transcriptional regulator n=1 Tax=Paracoccus onubensis TaxID=1675788 RepID=UPI00272EFC2E|nr:TetR/AcrR family transcriptional regulator [Paracoccus onubensis]MDP0930094.1 TetR/AcrR family transcriptional regulator [Paracoccus onubensis]